jgi:hypothetical protein
MPVPNASSARARSTVFDLTRVCAGPMFGYSNAEIASLRKSKVI